MMRRIIFSVVFVMIVGGGAGIAVAQDQGKTEDIGAPQSGCASPVASPAASLGGAGTATPDAELGSYAPAVPGASPEASPSTSVGCATPGAGTPAP